MNTNKNIKTNNSSLKTAAIGAVLITFGTMTACASPVGTQTAPDNNAQTKIRDDNQKTNSKPDPSKAIPLTEHARHIQQALASNDYAAIIDDIHPTRGVTFSMYAYVDPDEDKTFSRAQFAKYLEQSNIRFTWGARDGIGTPLITPLPDYLDDWVQAKDFSEANSKMTINGFLGRGNSLNNLKDIYQDADFVEFYYEGTNEYSGMDWRALRLVFDEYQGQRYLVAIINDQWTV